eukprot:TRINITY_DN2099_c0_g1_i1.p1 TRINITY_DN2099_c0_g1~~TRINITY_DN2099_c0_g1_i1.p1  ORF type:complete len:229 (-),score=75.62 TRINITY_DN2099_c0_g1_i1:216-878(-)
MARRESLSRRTSLSPSPGNDEWRESQQFFEFSPPIVLEELSNTLYEHFADAVDQLEQLLNHPRLQNKENVSKGVEKMFEILQERLDINFDKFEMYTLNNIFKRPIDSTIDIDSSKQFEQKTKKQKTEQQQLTQEINTLTDQLLQAVKENRQLNTQRKRLERQLQLFEDQNLITTELLQSKSAFLDPSVLKLKEELPNLVSQSTELQKYILERKGEHKEIL